MKKYRLNSNKLTLGEAWRIGGFKFAGLRLLRIPVAGDTPILADGTSIQRFSFDDFPTDLRELLEPEFETAKSQGFEHRFCARAWSHDPKTMSHVALFSKSGSDSVLSLLANREGDRPFFYREVSSQGQAGQELLDTTTPYKFEKPEWTTAEFHSLDTSVQSLWDSHQRRIKSHDLRSVPDSDEELLLRVQQSQDRWIDYGLKRGILSLM